MSKCDINRAYAYTSLAGDTGCRNEATKKIKLLDGRVIEVCEECLVLYRSCLDFEEVDCSTPSNTN